MVAWPPPLSVGGAFGAPAAWAGRARPQGRGLSQPPCAVLAFLGCSRPPDLEGTRKARGRADPPPRLSRWAVKKIGGWMGRAVVPIFAPNDPQTHSEFAFPKAQNQQRGGLRWVPCPEVPCPDPCPKRPPNPPKFAIPGTQHHQFGVSQGSRGGPGGPGGGPGGSWGAPGVLEGSRGSRGRPGDLPGGSWGIRGPFGGPVGSLEGIGALLGESRGVRGGSWGVLGGPGGVLGGSFKVPGRGPGGS